MKEEQKQRKSWESFLMSFSLYKKNRKLETKIISKTSGGIKNKTSMPLYVGLDK